MTREETDEYLAAMSNQQLIAAFREAEDDLATAAANEPNSEWHEACFAGLLVFLGEMSKRGIRPDPLH